MSIGTSGRRFFNLDIRCELSPIFQTGQFVFRRSWNCYCDFICPSRAVKNGFNGSKLAMQNISLCLLAHPDFCGVL